MSDQHPAAAHRYEPFVDWMKCLGIFLIVQGHVAATPFVMLVPPILTKQLGVALFVFVLGHGLARDRRPPWEVVVGRMFEICLFALAFAVGTSIVSVTLRGDLSASNYLPLLGGVNVVFDAFPVNPTTWFIGTYLHFLLLWAILFRRVRVSPAVLVAGLGFEVVARASIELMGLNYVAYMTVPNWLTVFLVGLSYGQREPATFRISAGGAAACLGGLAALVGVWHVASRDLVVERSFPLMRLGVGMAAFDWVLTSAAVSVLYVGVTWIVFHFVRRMPMYGCVRFVARNTLIVFIAHMPVYYLLEAAGQPDFASPALRMVTRVLVCLVAVAAGSEAIRRVTRPRRLRAWVVTGLRARLSAA